MVALDRDAALVKANAAEEEEQVANIILLKVKNDEDFLEAILVVCIIKLICYVLTVNYLVLVCVYVV